MATVLLCAAVRCCVLCAAVRCCAMCAAVRCCELELELIQSHMAQKPVLRGEVGCACVAREVSCALLCADKASASCKIRDLGLRNKQFACTGLATRSLPCCSALLFATVCCALCAALRLCAAVCCCVLQCAVPVIALEIPIAGTRKKMKMRVILGLDFPTA